MKRLYKSHTLSVRLTPDQRRSLDVAAREESKRRGEIVSPGTLLREEAMRGVSRILSVPTSDVS